MPRLKPVSLPLYKDDKVLCAGQCFVDKRHNAIVNPIAKSRTSDHEPGQDNVLVAGARLALNTAMCIHDDSLRNISMALKRAEGSSTGV